MSQVHRELTEGEKAFLGCTLSGPVHLVSWDENGYTMSQVPERMSDKAWGRWQDRCERYCPDLREFLEHPDAEDFVIRLYREAARARAVERYVWEKLMDDGSPVGDLKAEVDRIDSLLNNAVNQLKGGNDG